MVVRLLVLEALKCRLDLVELGLKDVLEELCDAFGGRWFVNDEILHVVAELRFEDAKLTDEALASTAYEQDWLLMMLLAVERASLGILALRLIDQPLVCLVQAELLAANEASNPGPTAERL